MLQISVIDNGPGISQQDLQKLFKPFAKLDCHADINPKGTGLGLSICRLICRSLGGDIKVSSGFGTKFTFWVAVKIPVDYDLNFAPTDRPSLKIEDIQIQEVHTKGRVNMRTFLSQPNPFE
jgi:hypothetical protein